MVSIVTVCYNAEKNIGRCLRSVYKLSNNDYEYIIVDGKSEDKTLKIIQDYLPKFKNKNIKCTLISEIDTGIYNAMNKAIDMAEGEWILYLNSDDYFASTDSLSVFVKSNIDNFDVVYGDVVVKTKNKMIYQKAKDIKLLKSGYMMPFCHQSTFTKTAVIKKYRFNENYKIVADIDLYLRMFEDSRKFKHIPYCISIFSNSGVSQTNRMESICEGKKLLKNHHLLNLEKRLILNSYLAWYFIKRILYKKYCIINF